MYILPPAFWLLGYLLGSLPFALWITRIAKGVDVREGGSGHVTTTNTIRQAGWAAGAVVFLLDFGKGFLAVYLAKSAGLPDWSIGMTGALAVAGHCWPLFAQFRGGMGLATTAGALTAVSPLGFLLAFATLLFFVLVIRHSARGSLVAGVVAPLVLWLVGLRGAVIWLAVGAGIVVAVRFTIDWNRKYRELWLDREKKPKGLI
jgi:glycerol-3-phosphate acyltransferase PlsY